jgi:hypothetical protein
MLTWGCGMIEQINLDSFIVTPTSEAGVTAESTETLVPTIVPTLVPTDTVEPETCQEASGTIKCISTVCSIRADMKEGTANVAYNVPRQTVVEYHALCPTEEGEIFTFWYYLGPERYAAGLDTVWEPNEGE